MEFWKRKAATMASMNATESDKSPKGSIDTPIIPLLHTLNHHPSFFTTSSCSGRISVLSQPTTTITTTKKKAKGGSWIFITHDPADPDSLTNLLFHSTESTHSDSTPSSELVFRFEPLIIAVECKDVGSAQFLVSLAISCGFRESGITSVSNKRVIIAIRCSIRLEVPLGNTGRLMVSDEYVRYIVRIANEKMAANRIRTEGFLQVLQKNGFGGHGVVEIGEHLLLNDVGDSENGVFGSEVRNSECTQGVCDNAQEGDGDSKRIEGNTHLGGEVSVVKVVVVGESVEKLFLWGHSACKLNNPNNNTQVLVFGGFGGIGRHARRNDCLLLDPLSGTLKEVEIERKPSPRLGHTSSLIGDFMFVIGGRADPVTILNDVWVLDTAKSEWTLLECTGCVFPPRHRHASAIVDSNIYVFGGLNDTTIYSSLHVLDTEKSQWNEICPVGEWPCARHSHSLVAFGSQLFMFGGYNGEKALGDLYSFDLYTHVWKKENTSGRAPYPRFSHSMFVYKNYIGIIGGCPIRQHCQELELLDTRTRLWKHVVINSLSKELFVRSTVNVIGDDLVILGGGTSCYAFGTKFSEPVEINLLSVTFLFHASHWILQLERKNAKLGKDVLKKFGWLDLGRKVYSLDDGRHICFPVNEDFCSVFHDKQQYYEDVIEGLCDLHGFKSFMGDGFLLNEISALTALKLLRACGGTKLADEVVKARKAPISPLKAMTEAIASLMNQRGLPEELLEQLPTRWERLGDIIVLPVTSFKDPIWDSIGEELWPTIAKSLGSPRLARQGRVAGTGTRDSSLEMLVGDNGWVDHRENGILYSFDATKCMFSWGNLSEKLRMARLDCKDEVIVDLFAGIGYFVLPFLISAKAKLVYACEWNPHALEALRHNIESNSVADRCIVLEGDNRLIAPKGVANRVCLGLLPTSEGSWATAVRALRSEGGKMHVHGNVKDTEEVTWTEHLLKSIHEIATSEGYCWEISIKHLERVKWYAPHIRHLVADVICRHIQR